MSVNECVPRRGNPSTNNDNESVPRRGNPSTYMNILHSGNIFYHSINFFYG